MVDLVYYLKNVLFFDIPLLYYYVNFRLSIFFCLFSGDIHIYLSWGISLSCSFLTISELLFCEGFEIFVILSAITSAVFRIALFAALIYESVADC